MRTRLPFALSTLAAGLISAQSALANDPVELTILPGCRRRRAHRRR